MIKNNKLISNITLKFNKIISKLSIINVKFVFFSSKEEDNERDQVRNCINYAVEQLKIFKSSIENYLLTQIKKKLYGIDDI